MTPTKNSAMSLPQIVGLRCVSCDSTISSIAEGVFCQACGNPIHVTCLQQRSASTSVDRCQVCGGDPTSPIAAEVKAEAEEQFINAHTRLTCPSCGYTKRFRSFETTEQSGGPGVMIPMTFAVFYVVFAVILGVAQGGQIQCCRCDYVFRPPSRIRGLGCFVLLALFICGIIAITFFSYFRH
jgi:hypothetical protein